MARIRTIKPEFFTSADIVSLTPLARLFYVALWCESDREGRLPWSIKTLKLRYLPGDNCDVHELAQELIDAELIVLYEVDGKEYAEIPGFVRHQVINNRESESVIPPRVVQSGDASGTRAARVKAEGKEGREGKGREDASRDAGDGDDDDQILIPLSDGSEYEIPLADIAEWEQAYPRIDVIGELRKARAWARANPAQRKTRRGASKFLNGWLSRSAERKQANGTVVPITGHENQPGGGRKLLA